MCVHEQNRATTSCQIGIARLRERERGTERERECKREREPTGPFGSRQQAALALGNWQLVLAVQSTFWPKRVCLDLASAHEPSVSLRCLPSLSPTVCVCVCVNKM